MEVIKVLNNYKEFLVFIKNLDYKPKLLLHSCCAPCSSHTILVLKEYFDITIFYSNDNIYPYDEYQKRLDEQIDFCNKHNIKVLNNYNDKDFYEAIRGYESLGEGTKRCYLCYKLRLEKTCKLAKELEFDYFSTTLSISPYKNSKWINEIGYELENIYGVNYLYSDFKKENGYQNSIALSKEYGLYRQDYCGCVFSIKEKEEKDGKTKEN
jgi:predicted adenine nucleotide alpha hydrolase (AANH) superfamily ATPase